MMLPSISTALPSMKIAGHGENTCGLSRNCTRHSSMRTTVLPRASITGPLPPSSASDSISMSVLSPMNTAVDDTPCWAGATMRERGPQPCSVMLRCPTRRTAST